MMNKTIAHLADIQVRKQIRHDEFRQVFERTYADLKIKKPNRIFLGGDIFHNKVDMSPNLITMVSDFFTNLSKIAPVDIIPGNHDMNLSQLSQGDSIHSIVSLLFNAEIVTQQNKELINFSKKYEDRHGIFYFPESGFYDIGDNIIYGHYSCIDGHILSLSQEEKIKGKKYIALYHGQVYESMNDNGMINKDPYLLKVSAFSNFDIVMMGDIHEHQTFRTDESMAYSGSLLQNNFSESLDKGYILWDLNTNSFKRKLIQNDYGFAKIKLSKGEIWEERLSTIKFSNNQKKTKVYIEWSDFEENYSLERESQLIKYIKDNYGCEIVTVDFKTIFKDNQLNIDDNEVDNIIEKDIKELLIEWWEQNKNNYDVEPEFVNEIIDLSNITDAALEIEPTKNYSNVYWYIQSMEVSNLFSYGTTPVKLDFEKLQGLTGIFGQNYSGKTNFIKTMVWGLFQYMLGGGDTKKLVNIYTGSDKAYVNIYLNIGGLNFRILRQVRNYIGRGTDSEIKTEYKVSYEVYEQNILTKEYEWKSEINDKKTNDKKAVKDLIIESIGTAQDFSKVNLQSENGKDNYLNSDQPSKNDVISKYIGLQSYQDRYDYAKKIFNDTIKEQKKLGNINEVQNQLNQLKEQYKLDSENLEKINKEKEQKNKLIEKINSRIVTLTSTLDKLENLNEENLDKLNTNLENKRNEFKSKKEQYSELDKWINENNKQVLTEVVKETPAFLQQTISQKESELNDILTKLPIAEKWINENPKLKENSTKENETIISKLKEDITLKKSKLPSFRGEKCPTCGSEKKKAEPEKEKECLYEIENIQNEINKNTSIVDLEKNKVEHNIKFDKASNKLDTLKNSVSQYENEIKEFKRKFNVLELSKDIINNNKTYDEKNELYKTVKKSLEDIKNNIDLLKEQIVKAQSNKEKREKNKSIEELIASEKETLSDEKLFYVNIDRQTTELYGNLRVTQRSIEDLDKKIETIKEQEKEYKKYSIYLQAVHKDGIPSQIIKKKLPIINSKIRSILKDLVEYKIEMWLDEKGNVRESFFYNDDKSDILPMDASSGAQGFLANLAIRDALHYVSKLPKSSMCIIDEGFGKLDANIAASMQQPLQYLKNKYKNVFVIAHTEIIKDFMDNIISVSKGINDIPLEYQEKYPQAWNTCISIK